MQRVIPTGVRPRLGIVTGLASEAVVVTALAGRDAPSVRVVCAGASSERAAALARDLVDAGVEALLSFGLAGALAPELDCGEIILAEAVRGPQGEVFSCDAGWRGALAAGFDGAGLADRKSVV